MELTVKSLKNNPENPKIEADDDFIEKFENYAGSIGTYRQYRIHKSPIPSYI